MGKRKKILIRMAAVFLIPCFMQCQLAFAAALQQQSADLATASENEAASAGESGADLSDTESQQSEVADQSDQSSDTSDPNGGEQSDELTEVKEDGNGGDSSGGSSDQKEDGSLDGSFDQKEGSQSADVSDQNMDEQILDESQGNDEYQEDIEDDDDWADGDDEWTDAWTAADDDRYDGDGEWADDRDKMNEAEISGADSEPYAGESVYTAKSTASGTTSNDNYEQLDQNYQTGAGVGNDIFLILAVLCGIMAIGLAAGKSIRKN
ncbi:MAG: hypothetical protein K2P69_04580 [Eubacterium sp.]|nr:hypothetical protein [Eubacterium sp.]